ncbi:MAG: hypothetical protein OCD00_07410 [Colwellia sp.]
MFEPESSKKAKAVDKLAQQLFSTKLAYQGLNQLPETSAVSSNGTVFNDLVQLIRGNYQLDRQQLMHKINQDLTLRRTYTQLLQQLKFAKSGLQAAASSGDNLPARITEQFSLKFKRDKNYPTQVYVILTIKHPKEHHNNSAISLHMTNQNQAECILFPKLVDGLSQLLMDDNNHAFQLLVDDNSQLYLI